MNICESQQKVLALFIRGATTLENRQQQFQRLESDHIIDFPALG